MNPIPQGGPTLQDKMVKPAYANISYGNASKTQSLDIYLPEKKNGPYPVVIYAHPGGFKFGDKKMASYNIVSAMLKEGYAFVSVNYRLSGESRFPAAVQDFFKASEFIVSHAGDYNLNASTLFFYGESAGANIVSLAGVAYADPVFNQTKKDAGHYIKPNGVIALYPPIDFGKIAQFTASQGCQVAGEQPGLSLEEQYIGGKLADNARSVQAANPVTYISRNAPAFFIENGSKDCNVGAKQSQILVDALKKQGNPVTYTMIDGAGHGGLEFERPENIAKIIDFLQSSSVTH